MTLEKHRNKVRKEVERRQLTSIMNNTKWQEFKNAMIEELSFPPAYSRKDILDDDYKPLSNDVSYLGDYVEGLHPFYSIEWIEVRPRILEFQGHLIASKIVSVENDFVKILKKYNIPYKDNAGSYLITGYSSSLPSGTLIDHLYQAGK